MSKDYRNMKDDELVSCILWDSQKAGALNELRKRRPLPGTRKIDPGHFYVCNFGSLDGYWGFIRNGKTVRASLMGDLWEEYKRTHPNWAQEGKE